MKEKDFKPLSGYLMAAVVFILLAISAVGLAAIRVPWFGIVLFFTLILTPGFFFITPNNSRVLTLFGEYKGSVKTNGFFWVNPLMIKQNVSLRARNFDSERVKVNDKVGNPILIGVILVWKVSDTFKAAFEVDHYESFVRIQSDAAVRKLAGQYPYDNFEDEEANITLRSGLNEVNKTLEKELSNRLEIAGIDVIEARIGYLAYASEIAGAMLRRQQATAIVAARHKIVEGAVSMVEMALEDLSKKEIIEFDEDKKATMVSNLMVVLCGDRDPQPIVNTGTLHQ